MGTEGLALAATIILVVPMLYFLIASPAFLLRPLSDPVVSTLLHRLYQIHFALVAVTCGMGVLAFLLAGRPFIALGLVATAALAVGARRWFMAGLDRDIRARDGGDPVAVGRMRRLHVAGMVFNATQLVAIMASISRVFPEAG